MLHEKVQHLRRDQDLLPARGGTGLELVELGRSQASGGRHVRKVMLGCVLLCGLVSVARSDDPEPPDKGLRELKGTWIFTKVLFRGRELKSPDEAATWVFDGRKLTQTYPPNKRKGKE